MGDEQLPEHVQRNRQAWDGYAAQYAAPGRRAWASDEVSWGIFSVPESQLRLFPDDMSGLDAVELGCGTAYVSSWMARRGARPVGIDNSPKQLETARALQEEFSLRFPLHLGNAEKTPFDAESFDFAISEYGAAIWCDPYEWIPEAARILKPGGQLVFLGNGLLLMLATHPDSTEETPVSTQFERPLFGMHRVEWIDTEAVEFHLPHGKMISLLRESGFHIEDLIEVEVPAGSTTSYPYVSLEWARKWPCEEVWKVRKRG
ncbi:MAG: class I SAM-dependent methyltransferase [Thermomicrobiales bacterium]